MSSLIGRSAAGEDISLNKKSQRLLPQGSQARVW